MDIMSLLGLIFAGFLLIFGMSESFSKMEFLSNFWDYPSLAIVIGGTFAALMITFPLKTFASLPKLLLMVFLPKKYIPQNYIREIVDIAYTVRRDGILSVEDRIEGCKDEFMRKGLQLAVDATDPENIRDIMEMELSYMMDRHSKGTAFFEKGASLAPGFGMLGTLVGLINMLVIINDDPDSLTSNMAIALITTYYGSLLANVIFIPMANKLQERSAEEVLCKQIIIEGIISMVNGVNPKEIQERLLSFIPPAMRNLDKDKKESKNEASDSAETTDAE